MFFCTSIVCMDFNEALHYYFQAIVKLKTKNSGKWHLDPWWGSTRMTSNQRILRWTEAKERHPGQCPNCNLGLDWPLQWISVWTCPDVSTRAIQKKRPSINLSSAEHVLQPRLKTYELLRRLGIDQRTSSWSTLYCFKNPSLTRKEAEPMMTQEVWKQPRHEVEASKQDILQTVSHWMIHGG